MGHVSWFGLSFEAVDGKVYKVKLEICIGTIKTTTWHARSQVDLCWMLCTQWVHGSSTWIYSWFLAVVSVCGFVGCIRTTHHPIISPLCWLYPHHQHHYTPVNCPNLSCSTQSEAVVLRWQTSTFTDFSSLDARKLFWFPMLRTIHEWGLWLEYNWCNQP